MHMSRPDLKGSIEASLTLSMYVALLSVHSSSFLPCLLKVLWHAAADFGGE